jgi:uncharacterized membrane protein (DUF2068 family)
MIGWELIVCGLRAHALVGTDAAALRPQDTLFAREYDGQRWYRCLRCDSWVALAPPSAPIRPHPPDRDAIEIPTRGKALRDKVVLRAIAVERSVHFLILGALGIAVLVLAANDQSARGDFERVLAAFQTGVAGGPVQTTGHVGIVRDLDKLFSLQASTLRAVGIALLAYATLEGTEAVGLWFLKRWAEYLTFLATAIPLPFEVYEIVEKVSILKILGLIINLAILAYLLVAKRLFGLRGGGRVDASKRAADMSWSAIEATTPPVAEVG